MVIEALKQHRVIISTQIRELKDNLVHLDAVIAMMEPGMVRPPRKPRGAVTRVVLDALRSSGRRMTEPELAEAVGLEPQQIRIALTQQRQRGLIRKIQEPGQDTAWEIMK